MQWKKQMTGNDFVRGQLASFAIEQAGANAPVDHMKAIALCMRNRARAGWHDGDWLENMFHADRYSAHDPGPRVRFELGDRSQSRLIREVDEIFFSRSNEDNPKSSGDSISFEEAVGKSCYWLFVNRPVREWFKSTIIRDPENHRQGASLGLMMLFE
jgi:hypothetical protein